MPVKPTPKAVLVAAVAALLLAASLAGLYPYTTGSAAVFLLALLGWSLGVAESLSRAASRVEVSRIVEPESAYEDTPVQVTVRIANKSTWRLEAVFEEALPPRLKPVDPPVFAASLEPGGEAVYTYRVRPLPGLHVLRGTMVSVVDPLGLFAYQRFVQKVSTVKASPVARPLRGGSRSSYWGYMEAYSRLVRGVGLEFYEVREYQPGDDPRRIVWTATARTGRLMVREDLTETMSRIHLLVDLSAQMWAGTQGDTPGDHAARLAVSIASTVARVAGQLGYTLLRGAPWSTQPPTRAGEALSKLIVALAGFDPREAVTSTGWNLCRAVDEAYSLLPRDTILLVITGPHAVAPPRLDTLVACLGGRPRTAVLIAVPRGEGRESALIRSYTLKLLGPAVERLARSGVRVFYSDGPTPQPELWRWLATWI